LKISKGNSETDDTRESTKGPTNDLQNITQKTKDWATRTPLNSGRELN
jgi:hypothetical protein